MLLVRASLQLCCRPFLVQLTAAVKIAMDEKTSQEVNEPGSAQPFGPTPSDDPVFQFSAFGNGYGVNRPLDGGKAALGPSSFEGRAG